MTSATIFTVLKARLAESAESCGAETLSSFSLGIILIWPEAIVTKARENKKAVMSLRQNMVKAIRYRLQIRAL